MRFLFLVGLVGLAACDGTAPAPPEPPPEVDAIVGTWRLDGLFREVWVVSRETQTLPDLQAEGTGGIVVERAGADPAVLRHAVDRLDPNATFYPPPVNEGFVEFRTERATGPLEGSAPEYTGIRASRHPGRDGHPGSVVAQVFVKEVNRSVDSYVWRGPESAVAYELDGTAVSIPPRTLSGQSGEVVVSGTITFPRIPVVEGEPTRIQVYPLTTEGTGLTTFEADGTYRYDSMSGIGTPYEGRWTRLEDGTVEVSGPTLSGGGSVLLYFDAEVRDGRLRLRLTSNVVCNPDCQPQEIPCEGVCLRDRERALLASPGSLSSVELMGTEEMIPLA